MASRRLAYLRRMGIDVYVRREPPASAGGAPATTTAAGLARPRAEDPSAVPDEALDWQALAARVATCTRCPLHEGRTQTVFGVGDPRAGLVAVGEAPGAEEDRQGEPFVGPAGQLLDRMLEAIGQRRGDGVFIANILKCRPPRNRDPRPEEVSACEPYLRRQLALIRPRVILALGRVAAQNLLRTDAPLGRLRGREHTYDGVPVVVTYHPAYLLRSPQDKRKAWADLKRARALLAAGRC